MENGKQMKENQKIGLSCIHSFHGLLEISTEWNKSNQIIVIRPSKIIQPRRSLFDLFHWFLEVIRKKKLQQYKPDEIEQDKAIYSEFIVQIVHKVIPELQKKGIKFQNIFIQIFGQQINQRQNTHNKRVFQEIKKCMQLSKEQIFSKYQYSKLQVEERQKISKIWAELQILTLKEKQQRLRIFEANQNWQLQIHEMNNGQINIKSKPYFQGSRCISLKSIALTNKQQQQLENIIKNIVPRIIFLIKTYQDKTKLIYPYLSTESVYIDSFKEKLNCQLSRQIPILKALGISPQLLAIISDKIDKYQPIINKGQEIFWRIIHTIDELIKKKHVFHSYNTMQSIQQKLGNLQKILKERHSTQRVNILGRLLKLIEISNVQSNQLTAQFLSNHFSNHQQIKQKQQQIEVYQAILLALKKLSQILMNNDFELVLQIVKIIVRYFSYYLSIILIKLKQSSIQKNKKQNNKESNNKQKIYNDKCKELYNIIQNYKSQPSMSGDFYRSSQMIINTIQEINDNKQYNNLEKIFQRYKNLLKQIVLKQMGKKSLGEIKTRIIVDIIMKTKSNNYFIFGSIINKINSLKIEEISQFQKDFKKKLKES